MKGFLLDTNIPSEMTRPSPRPSVSGWLDDADDDQLYFVVFQRSLARRGSEGRYAAFRKQAPHPMAVHLTRRDKMTLLDMNWSGPSVLIVAAVSMAGLFLGQPIEPCFAFLLNGG